MRYLIVLFICIGICLAGEYRRGGRPGRKVEMNGANKPLNMPPNPPQKDYIASIIQLPSVYHSCNAFFVTKDILIAPASCLLCNEVCKFQVAIRAVSIFNNPRVYEIKKILMHPKFLEQVPDSNPGYNIALVKIADPPKDVQPLLIPRNLQTKEGYIRAWTFNKDMTDFSLRAHVFEKVTHYVCDENQVRVQLDEVCIQGFHSVELGNFNEGTVFVSDGANLNSPSVAMGFYAKIYGFTGASKYYSFVSLEYYHSWINKAIKELN